MTRPLLALLAAALALAAAGVVALAVASQSGAGRVRRHWARLGWE